MKYINELNTQIRAIDEEVERLRSKFKTENGWTCEASRLRAIELRKKRGDLFHELITR